MEQRQPDRDKAVRVRADDVFGCPLLYLAPVAELGIEWLWADERSLAAVYLTRNSSMRSKHEKPDSHV